MEIKIFDSLNNELKPGDKVMLQAERNGTLTFYTTIQIINNQIFPLNKFYFDRMIKVDSIPNDCKYAPAKTENNFPEYWMHPKIELMLIKENRLNKWKHDVLYFENNSFYKIFE